ETAVDEQDDYAHTQKQGYRITVEVGRQVEEPVKAAEEGTPPGIDQHRQEPAGYAAGHEQATAESPQFRAIATVHCFPVSGHSQPDERSNMGCQEIQGNETSKQDNAQTRQSFLMG